VTEKIGCKPHRLVHSHNLVLSVAIFLKFHSVRLIHS